jgi:hypothetical protein
MKDKLYAGQNITQEESPKYLGEEGVDFSSTSRICLNFLRLYTDNRTSFSISLIIRSLSSSSCSSSPAKWDTLLALQCASLRNLNIEFQL